MIVCADARQLPLADGCVQCVVTSPPYFGLRDYGTARWDGGDIDCAHRVPATGSTQNKGNNNREGSPFKDACDICGARRVDAQIGLEPTPAAYVASLVTVFREVWRVLRNDGTVWLNLGDSYVNTGMSDTSSVGGFTGDRIRRGVKGIMDSRPRAIPHGLKVKDLTGIPWRVAFALQAEGWYLRSDIIWAKPNPMPESVTDRPTKAHEYLFLLSKSERYVYDADAIREAGVGREDRGDMNFGARLNSGAPWTGCTYGGKHAETEPNAAGRRMLASVKAARDAGAPHDNPFNGRNKRSVWTIPTMPYAGAHFATMPEALIEPCILAGCPLGGLVCDPFLGSGTVGAVAARLGRRWVGTDLAYHDLAAERTAQRGLAFA